MDTIEIDEFTKNRLIGIASNIYNLQIQASIICDAYVSAKGHNPTENKFKLLDDCSQLVPDEAKE